MQRTFLTLVAACLFLFAHTPVGAFDCELDTIMRDGKQVGTVVVNGLDVYCGTVYFRGGGYSVHFDDQPKKFYNKDYDYREVLNYMCDSCLYKRKENLSGQ